MAFTLCVQFMYFPADFTVSKFCLCGVFVTFVYKYRSFLKVKFVNVFRGN
jgi:hypothetical protein